MTKQPHALITYKSQTECKTADRARLRHRKHVNNSNSVVINKFTKHQTHNLHWHTSTAMFQHLHIAQAEHINRCRHKQYHQLILQAHVYKHTLPTLIPRRRLRRDDVNNFTERALYFVLASNHISIYICSQEISLQLITMCNESRTTRHR